MDEKQVREGDSRIAHWRNNFQDPPHARLRATKPRVSSRNRRAAFEILRNVGTTSEAVTRADMTIRGVVNTRMSLEGMGYSRDLAWVADQVPCRRRRKQR